MYRPELHAANVLNATVAALGRELDAVTAEAADGPGGRGAALTALAAFASGSPIDRLAWSLQLSHSRMVRIVDALEADGLVTRSRDTADRRAVLVALTASGRKVAGEITDARLALLREDVAALGEADREALARICGTILARRIGTARAAERTCRFCDPEACGHHDGHCPVTRAADVHRARAA
jgi:DNA-binding MarR family transcriptional regulator